MKNIRILCFSIALLWKRTIKKSEIGTNLVRWTQIFFVYLLRNTLLLLTGLKLCWDLNLSFCPFQWISILDVHQFSLLSFKLWSGSHEIFISNQHLFRLLLVTHFTNVVKCVLMLITFWFLFPFADISTEEESCKSDDPSENKSRRLAGIIIIKQRNFILSLRFNNLYYTYSNGVSERGLQRSEDLIFFCPTLVARR